MNNVLNGTIKIVDALKEIHIDIQTTLLFGVMDDEYCNMALEKLNSEKYLAIEGILRSSAKSTSPSELRNKFSLFENLTDDECARIIELAHEYVYYMDKILYRLYGQN